MPRAEFRGDGVGPQSEVLGEPAPQHAAPCGRRHGVAPRGERGRGEDARRALAVRGRRQNGRNSRRRATVRYRRVEGSVEVCRDRAWDTVD